MYIQMYCRRRLIVPSSNTPTRGSPDLITDWSPEVYSTTQDYCRRFLIEGTPALVLLTSCRLSLEAHRTAQK